MGAINYKIVLIGAGSILDLSANSDHNLGRVYSLQKLRAIRRLSIHRVFDILDTRFEHNQNVHLLLEHGND